jgi:alpha-L-fucosidase
LIHTATKGGNLLLNVSPRADGTLPEEQTDRLRDIGSWLDRHGPALFGTIPGLPAGLFEGASTLSPDRQTLYLITSAGGADSLALQGINAPVVRVEHLASGATVPHRFIAGAEWAGVPGVLWVDLATELRDPLFSVLRVHLAKPLEIYLGSGQVLSQAGG